MYQNSKLHFSTKSSHWKNKAKFNILCIDIPQIGTFVSWWLLRSTEEDEEEYVLFVSSGFCLKDTNFSHASFPAHSLRKAIKVTNDEEKENL